MSLFWIFIIILIVLAFVGIAFLIIGITKDESWGIWTGIALLAPLCIVVALWPIFLIFSAFGFGVYALDRFKPPTLPTK